MQIRLGHRHLHWKLCQFRWHILKLTHHSDDVFSHLDSSCQLTFTNVIPSQKTFAKITWLCIFIPVISNWIVLSEIMIGKQPPSRQSLWLCDWWRSRSERDSRRPFKRVAEGLCPYLLTPPPPLLPPLSILLFLLFLFWPSLTSSSLFFFSSSSSSSSSSSCDNGGGASQSPNPLQAFGKSYFTLSRNSFFLKIKKTLKNS